MKDDDVFENETIASEIGDSQEEVEEATCDVDVGDEPNNVIGLAEVDAGPSRERSKISLEEIRLDQNYVELVEGEEVLATVQVEKPPKHVFFRVHPDADWRLPVHILEDKEERENYLVSRDLLAELADEVTAKLLYTTVDRFGVVRLWPVRLTGANGRLDSWNERAHVAAKMAETDWVRLIPDMRAGTYRVRKASAELGAPEFPTNTTFVDILNLAFDGRYITDRDHDVLRRLRGEQ